MNRTPVTRSSTHSMCATGCSGVMSPKPVLVSTVKLK